MPVTNPHKDYESHSTKWRRMRDVSAGHDAVQRAKDKYLPKLSDQTDPEYDAYLGRAVFLEATGRVIGALEGMVTRKPAVIEGADGIKDILEDITLSGVPFDQFAAELLREDLEVTRAGVLVDFPSVKKEDGEVITLEVARKRGLRVYATMYKAESIINWKTIQVGGKTVLGRVVLKECIEEQDPADPFATAEVEQYRVLQLNGSGYEVAIFREVKPKVEKAQFTEYQRFLPLMNGKPLDFIPFEFFGADGNTPKVDEPVLNGLAVLNLAHYRNSADFEHGLHFTGLPTAVISGVSGTDTIFSIGSPKAWTFADANAKASYLEFKGEGLSTLSEAMSKKEEQMAALGARMLSPEKKAAETTETITNKRQGETSMLASIANAISRGLTRVLNIMAEWEGKAANITVKLNTEYNVARLTPQEITALLSAVTTGQISGLSFYEAMVKGEIIAGTRTYQEEQVAIGETNLPEPQPAE